MNNSYYYFLKVRMVAGYTLALLAVPATSYAASAGQTFKSIVDSITSFIGNSIIPILVIVAIILFFWNLIQFLTHMDNEKEREKFRKYSVNALIALFVIFTVWGIVGIATKIFFGTGAFIPLLPVK